MLTAGAFEMEVNETCSEDICVMGNWDPKMQEKAYSTRLPLNAIRSKGGHLRGSGAYYIERGTVEPSQELLSLFWPWVDEQLQRVLVSLDMSNNDDPRWTARAFLKFMKRMKKVIMQDAACMLAKHPERCHHSLFKLPIFRSEQFLAFVELMKHHLDNVRSPVDVTVDQVLPGINQNMAAQVLEIQELRRQSREYQNETRGQLFSIRQDLSTVDNRVAIKIAHGLGRASTAMIQEAGGSSPTLSPEQEHHPMSQVHPENLPFPGCDYQPNWDDLKEPSQVIHQWFGLESYANIPVEGGLEAMERRRGRIWRQSWCKAAKGKTFSRMKKIASEYQRLTGSSLNHSPIVALTIMENDWSTCKSFSRYADSLGKKRTSEEMSSQEASV